MMGMRAWNLTQLPTAAGRRRRRSERDKESASERDKRKWESKSTDSVTGWPLSLCTWRWGQQSLLFCLSCHLLLTSTCCTVLFHSLCLWNLHLSASYLVSLSLFWHLHTWGRYLCLCCCLNRFIQFTDTKVESYNLYTIQVQYITIV